MRFLLDEGADFRPSGYLTELGHDVPAIVRGYEWALARGEGRILITEDRDFGELIFRQCLPHAGVILLRLGDEDIQTKQELLGRALAMHAADLGEFVVITPHRVRVRRITR